MNFYFGLFCSAGVMCSSELGSVLFFLLRNNSEEKKTDSYSSHFLLFGLYIQQNVNSAANFVKDAWFRCYRWFLFVRHIYSSLHSRSLNDICTVAILGQTLSS